MMNLKQKTIRGFKWSFIDSAAKYIFTFFVSIILARLLEPKEFGIAGLAGIFLAISRVFIDGGMGDALIRKKNTDNLDYNSIFLFNLILSIIFYLILFQFSTNISQYFGEVKLVNIIKVSGLGLIIGSFSIVQLAILRKQIDFKRQAIISFISSVIGGIISIIMAIQGYSYWSLIIPNLITGIITAVLLLATSTWTPSFSLSIDRIKEHFKFSSKIMATSFVYVIYQNMFSAFIGKNFSITDLGYYYKADNLQKLPSTNLDIIVRHVTYPVLATMQDDEQQLKRSYKILLKYTSLINGLIMLFVASLSEQIVLLLFGNKWLPSVPYLQLLCFVGMVFPLMSINANIFNVKGRSDITLYVTIIRIFLAIPAIIGGYYFGIITMIYGMILASFAHYFFIVVITKRFIDYPVMEQLIDVGVGLALSSIVSLPIYFLGKAMNMSPLIELLILTPLFLFFLVIAGRLSKNKEYKNMELFAINNARQRLSKKTK